MAVSQCFTTPFNPNLVHAGQNHGKLRAPYALPTRALALQLPISRGGMGFCSSTANSHGLSLLKLRLLPLTARNDRRTALTRTSACYRPPNAESPPTNKNVLVSLAVAIGIPLISGLLASVFNTANFDWYNRLRKPKWNPPAPLFGLAWGILYPVMGFASWLVWAHGGWEAQGYALSIYALQLVLNLLWPALFFGAKQIGLALLDILALWVALVACIRAFQPVNPLAARLLYPYLAWVTFATALNYSYLRLNTLQGSTSQA